MRIYDDITTQASEYYLFGAEEQILKDRGDEIVRAMHSRPEAAEDEIVVELGAGALRKTSHILLALSHLVPEAKPTPPITYYALDLEKRELERTLTEMTSSDVGIQLEGKVATKGMWGTYDGGLKFIEEGGFRGRDTIAPQDGFSFETLRDASPSSRSSSSPTTSSASDSDSEMVTAASTPDAGQSPLHILFLGSSLGNFPRGADAEFLRNMPLRPGSGDTLLLGLDHDNETGEIEAAYNDSKGITKKFIMNGLKAAGLALGDKNVFDQDKWDYVGKYNPHLRRHEAYYRSRCAQTVRDPSSRAQVEFLPDELVNVECSHKYSDLDAYTAFTDANLRPINRWTDNSSRYSLWLLERPPFLFPLLKPLDASPFSVPSVDDWKTVWASWDLITLGMISSELLFVKPIDLRHICLFYLGHIPTFLDIHLSKLLEEPHTNPEKFKDIFERGIDPNVDDPTKCHPHSEVPQSKEGWPTLDSILDFKSRVRQRLVQLYEDIASGKKQLTRKIGRVLFMTLEHESFHAETLLYMLLRRAGNGTLLPPGFTVPPWAALSNTWDAAAVPQSTAVTLGPEVVVIGHDDSEQDDASIDVKDHEFGWDNEHPKREVKVDKFKIDWRPINNGQFYEFYKGKGSGRVRFPESWIKIGGQVYVRTLYGPVPLKTAHLWPMLTTYDDLSTYAQVKGGRIPTEPELRLFFDKFEYGYEGGANVGYRNWHPVPATTGVAKGGKGHNGGVWEWTSTVFDEYDGFEPSKLYPGFSQDFFDGQHQTVIGGSYATIPRQANRRSLRNYYQHNYAYAWIGARVAYDV